MKRDSIDSFIDVYVQALRDQNAAIFAGAGLSIHARAVDRTAEEFDAVNHPMAPVDKN